jgi:hypothetical protein
LTAVPRYFFHLSDGGGFVEDEEGLDLPDDDAARAKATEAARSIMASDLLGGRLDLASFIAVQRDGAPAFTLGFAEVLETSRAPPR